MKCRFFALAATLVTVTVAAAPPEAAVLKPYQTTCTRSDTTGFAWQKGTWQRSGGHPGKRFTVRRIDSSGIPKGGAIREVYPMCRDGSVDEMGRGIVWVDACYLVTQEGAPESAKDARMCRENYSNGKLTAVSCGGLTLLPAGDFVEHPWPDPVTPNSATERRPSLVLSVGQCTRQPGGVVR